MVVVAQLVRAPDCGSGGRRFEPGLPPKIKGLFFRPFFVSILSFKIIFTFDNNYFNSFTNPIKYYKNNVVNLIKLVEIIDEYNIKSFVFSSSCTVYGTPEHTPVSEESDIKPAFSPYGFTKQVVRRHP